jgi:glyoxylase-like metal-dependent hydrolase (beta-lactamase superfamily II)
MSDRLYFRQLLAGRDFAVDDDVARQMRNFVYAIGDRESGEAVLVDPAYHPLELLELVRADGLELTGAIATHYHADHVGGRLMGRVTIAGVRELLDAVDVPVHVNEHERAWVAAGADVAPSSLVGHASGDVVAVGAVTVTLVHTPGHTPGSQCLLVDGCLVSGDTLFLEGCGRTDLPGADPDEMYRTLTERLAPIDDATRLFPGHLYSAAPSATLADVRATNDVLAPMSREQWRRTFGG